MSKPKPPPYRTTNWHDYNAALARRGSLGIWFDPETQWLAAPICRRGRQPVFTDAAIQACLTLKALFRLPWRQTTAMVAGLLDLAGLDWPVPDFSTLCRRLKTLTVHIPYRFSTDALHLLIDSTGVKAEGDGAWLAKKHDPSKPRDWCKVHLGIDADTLETRATEITGSRISDAPKLPDLLDQIPGDQPRGMVTADGAYDTRSCHAAIAARGAAAVIPPRRTGKPWKERTAGAMARNEALRSCRRLGRAIWKRWAGYHRRSLVEAKKRCFKLLGERVMSRDFDRQVAELQIRAAILNQFTALGPPLTQREGQVCPPKGNLRTSEELCNKASSGSEMAERWSTSHSAARSVTTIPWVRTH